MSDSIIESAWSHYVIIGCSCVGLVWGGINAMFVSLNDELMLTGQRDRPSSRASP